MTSVLVAGASVHTVAAACDYLDSRVGPDDEVLVVTVEESDVESRDGADAANVARTRLFEASVDSLIERGEPAAVIRRVARERDVDVILVGPHRGNPDAAGDPPGSTTRALCANPPAPVVVVPL